MNTKEKIKELAKLPDNWDSYGSKRVKKSVINKAIQVLDELDILGLNTQHVLPVPVLCIALPYIK